MVTAMRAARLHEIGGTLQIDEIDDPVPADDEVVVDIDYASVNPLDIWVTRGAPGVAAANLPWIPGTEGSGHLDGRAVLVRGAGLGVMRHGLYRERAAVPRSAVHELPDGLDLAQAAGMPVVGVTAWHAVHTCAQVTPDDRVLVLGASGGVGSVAVQLAAAVGATVWGQTGNAANVAAIAEDGAAEVLVTDAAGLTEAASAYAPTVVLDPLGGDFPDQAIAAMADRGRLVVYGASADPVGDAQLAPDVPQGDQHPRLLRSDRHTGGRGAGARRAVRGDGGRPDAGATRRRAPALAGRRGARDDPRTPRRRQARARLQRLSDVASHVSSSASSGSFGSGTPTARTRGRSCSSTTKPTAIGVTVESICESMTADSPAPAAVDIIPTTADAVPAMWPIGSIASDVSVGPTSDVLQIIATMSTNHTQTLGRPSVARQTTSCPSRQHHRGHE